MFSVRDRSVIVTGASGGLGERFTRVFATDGAPTVVAHQADLSDCESRPGVIDAAAERFGRVDVLANNASFGNPSPSVDESMDDFRSVIELDGVLLYLASDASTCTGQSIVVDGGWTAR